MSRCHEVQVSLSLYLYGELNFAAEESLERHLSGCPMCQLALSREKLWHASLNASSRDVPSELLAECRRDLLQSIRSPAAARTGMSRSSRFHGLLASFQRDWLGGWGFSATQWSSRVALASFFVFAGVVLSRWTDRYLPGFGAPTESMGILGAPESRIRNIQPDGDGRIRIVVDRFQQQELVGSAEDAGIRQLLVAAARNSADPGLRIDSVELLNQQGGDDIRDALISAVRHDPNSAVRLKALDSLSRFSSDHVTREALVSLLEHDADPGIRSRAIDVLLPPNARINVGPDLVRALQGISRADAEDDYVRARCLQILQAVGAPGFSSHSIY